MPWFKVDDALPSKLETTRIPRAHRAAAIGLWTLAGSWSARELTDGFIPGHMIDELAGTAEDAQRLVAAGFWIVVEGGFQFAVWDGQQPMREKVEEARAKNAAKIKNWRSRNQVGNQGSNPVTNSVSDDGVTLPPTRPVPVPVPDQEGSKDPYSKAREAKLSKDWAPTAEHIKRAKESGLNLDDEAENFRLHAETYDRRAVNWNAAFTTWLKKARPKNVSPIKKVATNDEWMYR